MTFEDLLKETISYPTRNGKRREIQVATAYWNERHPAHSYAVQFVKSRLPNKIYNENCLETMAKMPDNFIDLTVTSPPYDGMRMYK